jgi:hypothetical protein
MKTTHRITLSAAFLAIASDRALLNAATREALASDGEIIAALPLPEGFTQPRAITRSVNDLTLGPDDGDATEESFDTASLRENFGQTVYRLALNPAKLHALAAAIGSTDCVVIELSASPDLARVLPGDSASAAYGFIVPAACPRGTAGLLVETGTGNSQKESREKTTAELPPPIVTASIERHTLEIAFGGVPAKEIRDALKDPSLGFRYSGRGTKRGVPANVWYGPDNPFTRERIAALLPVPVQAAA